GHPARGGDGGRSALPTWDSLRSRQDERAAGGCRLWESATHVPPSRLPHRGALPRTVPRRITPTIPHLGAWRAGGRASRPPPACSSGGADFPGPEDSCGRDRAEGVAPPPPLTRSTPVCLGCLTPRGASPALLGTPTARDRPRLAKEVAT